MSDNYQLISLITIALFCILSFLFYRKKGLILNNKEQLIKLKGGLSIGTKEKVMLIEVKNREILIGVTNQSIQPLAILNNNNEKSLIDDVSKTS